MAETDDSTATTSNELVHVPFDDGEILCVRSDEDGEFVVIKPLCERIGVDARGQQQRIQRASWGKSCACIMHVQLPGDVQRREVFVLSRKRIAMWLATIDTNRVNEEVRPYLEALQERAADVLDAYFMGSEKLNDSEVRPTVGHRRQRSLDPERLAKADALAELARTFESPTELGARRGLLAQRCRVLGVRLPAELGLGRTRKRPTSASSAVQEQPAVTSTALVQVEARQEPLRRLRVKPSDYVVYEPHPSEPWWTSEEELAKVLPLPATQIRKTLIELDLCETPIPNFSRYQRVFGVPTLCYSPMAAYRVMKYWRRPAPTLIENAARAMALDLGVDL